MVGAPGTAVITGATGGIGRWIALGLARGGCRVVLVGRDAQRGAAAQDWIAAQVPGAATELFLADLSSVAASRDLGRRIAVQHPEIAILVHNAGTFRSRRERTAEGHDMVLAVNHLSPFVLTHTLQAALCAGAPARIVTVGSSTSDRARIDPADLDGLRRWGMVRSYGQSKLAVMMTTFEWARRLHGTGVVANVVHPGTVATKLVRTRGAIGLAWRLMAPWIRTEEQGAQTPLHLALSPDLAGVTGRYFKDRAVAEPNRRALDPALLRQVWDATERLVG